MGKKNETEKPPGQAPEPAGGTGLTETLEFLEGEMTAKKDEKKKRVHYQQKECPYCHAMVGNLGNHVKLKHPGEIPPPPELTKEDLLGVPSKEPKPKPPTELNPPTYYCTDCKAELRAGENPCWNCGAVLNWEGL